MDRTFKFNKENIKRLPEASGIYMFLNSKNKIIYVGKAKNLRSRLNSYTSKGILGKTRNMLKNSKNIEITITENEIESLILESILIKKYLPKYNILLKDDKNYLYIKITDEVYPRVLCARKKDNKYKYRYIFGPYPSAYQTRNLVKIIRKLIPFSTHSIRKYSCLESQIGLCNPCPSNIEREVDDSVKSKLYKEYNSNIKKIVTILSGDIKTIKSQLLREIERYSSGENYEKALEIKNKLISFEYISQNNTEANEYLKNPNLVEDIKLNQLRSLSNLLGIKKLLNRIECYDVAHISGYFTTASMVTFVEGYPDKKYYRHFKIKNKQITDDISSMKELAERRYMHIKNWGKPDMILVDGGIGQVKQFINIFRDTGVLISGFEKRSENLVIFNKKTDSVMRIRMKSDPAKNLVLNLISEAHRFSRRYHHHLIKGSLRPN